MTDIFQTYVDEDSTLVKDSDPMCYTTEIGIQNALEDDNKTASGENIKVLAENIFAQLLLSCDQSLEERNRLPNQASLLNINIHRLLKRIKVPIINKFNNPAFEQLSQPAQLKNVVAYSIVTHILGNAATDITNHYISNQTLASLYSRSNENLKEIIKRKIEEDCIKIYTELETLILKKSPLFEYYINKYYIVTTNSEIDDIDLMRKKIIRGIVESTISLLSWQNEIS